MIKSTWPVPAFFRAFEEPLAAFTLSVRFNLPFSDQPDPICLLAAKKLQQYLVNQQDWDHNFGLSDHQEGPVAGKMFGVLVVSTREGRIGYLSAFSGKLAGGNQHARFVPPIFDGTAEGGFLNDGMAELSRMSEEIQMLQTGKQSLPEEVRRLTTSRKVHSVSLQNRIFDQYHFLNQYGESKSLRTIFENASYRNPPAGAGECAAPKLLQYAFAHRLKPIAMAEFWWGLSTKSDFWKHGHFYPACKEKCGPILGHMLAGFDMDFTQADGSC